MPEQSELPPIADKPIPDHIEEDEHWWFRSRTLMINIFIQQTLSQTTDLSILDIGCGAGNMIHHLSHYGQVKGIDVDSRPVTQARLRGYDVDQFDATQPYPFDDHSFDLVTVFDIIEHVKADRAILEEAHRVLKPGGYIIITVPAFMFLWSNNDVINAHQRRYTIGELKTKLNQANFRLIRASYNNFFIFPLAAPLIMLRRGNEPELASHHLDEDEYQVEMEPASPMVNKILTIVGQVEAGLARVVNLPFGTSMIAVGQK